jgi:hypothetical protein
MGVNLKVIFPSSAKARDIFDVTAFCLGNEKEVRPHIPSVHAECDVVKIVPNSDGDMLTVFFESPLNGYQRMFYFHWQLGASEWVGPGFSMKSCADNIALARRLVTFFGGELDENDSDDTMVDLRCPPNPLNFADDGERWDALQVAKASVLPLTAEEIEAAEENAAYDWRKRNG